MSRPSLTVAIIALNEAARLRDLLPRLAFADQVLVVDGGSSDDTVAVSRGCGATVVARRFDDFAAQRNAAMDAAAGEWILFVDADERPTPALVVEMRRLLAQTTCVGFRVPIRSSILGRKFRFSGTQDDRPLRLVRRGAGRWVGVVHETFDARGGVGRCHAFLEHDGLPTRAAFESKMRRYTSLEAQSRTSHGVAPSFGARWIRPARELFRRLIWKHGWLDGPTGWRFALLSAKSEWVLATEHRRLWLARTTTCAATRNAGQRGAVEGAWA